MIVIGLTRAISAGVKGSEDQIWNSFWVQVEAAVSVIAVCPTAFRSLFLIKSSPKDTPDRHDPKPVSALERLWRRKRPSLASINVRATLSGMRTFIHGNETTQLESHPDEYALSSTEVQSTHTGASFEAPKRSVEANHDEAGAIV